MEIALILVIIASIFQGSFGLGMKFMAPLKWEAWWLVHSTCAMLVFPLIWALLAVPNLFQIISNSPVESVLMGALLGFLWGIGGILFGKSVPYIGMSLTYGIVMGLTSAIGSLIPLFQMENAVKMDAFPFVIIGVVVMLAGVAITAYAGIKKDKIDKDLKRGKINLKLGLTIAILSGVLSALLNIGFVNAQPVAKVAESAGVVSRNSSLAAWIVVLFGAYLMNAGYSVFLLIKNKTWVSFAVPNSRKAYSWSIIAGIFWFGALGLYGQGATLMGELGPVVGWPILLGLSLIVSNFWAYINKEWTGATKAFRTLIVGLLILIIATVILGYSNSLQ